ncbi:MAG TPA: hypothetical protein VFN97_10785 [Actinospica sp.]|nr:hypothetical protein [Actinospica sp.]
MQGTRTPNEQLRALLREATWSGAELAHAVNRLGAENGMRLNYSRASVGQWLAGTFPRRATTPLILEALGRRLGRAVTAAEASLAAAGAPARPPYSLEVLARIGPGAMSPPGLLPQVATAPGRLTHDHVRAARDMLTVFSRGDRMWGGGYGRGALASYLRTFIGPALELPGGPVTRGALRAVAAELSYLCGFMNFDDGRQGAAQRYYLTALRLADEAGRSESRAITLRAMSVQAESLGHHAQARQLACAALDASRPGLAPPEHTAFLLGQVGTAEAASGDRRAAFAALTRAEKLIERADSRRELPDVGTYHHASLTHQHAAIAARLGDHAAAISALEVSLRHRPPEERRSRAITLAQLAREQAAVGHLEASCATWNAFCDAYPEVRSARARRALETAYLATRAFIANPQARQVHGRVAELRAGRAPSKD